MFKYAILDYYCWTYGHHLEIMRLKSVILWCGLFFINEKKILTLFFKFTADICRIPLTHPYNDNSIINRMTKNVVRAMFKLFSAMDQCHCIRVTQARKLIVKINLSLKLTSIDVSVIIILKWLFRIEVMLRMLHIL